MKLFKRKTYSKQLFFSVFLIGMMLISCSTIQTVAEKEQIAQRVKEKVESSDFTFKAETVYPMNSKPIHLTSTYDLKVSKDTVKAFLPYFGRAYVAPLDPSEGGIKFLSTDFEYLIAKGKQPGNWNVTIKTHDTSRMISLFLTIWENGSAQLIVNDPDKQTITFDGSIVVNK